MPLKYLSAQSTAEALSQFLNFLPSPQQIHVDGGPEFSGAFEELCAQNDIFVITKITRRSQMQGSAEVSIRDFKAVLTRIAHAYPNGRTRWSGLLPIVLNALNSRHPYNQPISRKNLFLSPYYNNLLKLLFCPDEYLSTQFSPELINIQQQAHNNLNEKRKKALLRLHSKLNKPAQFSLKEGMILTENANQEDRETINGSRALLPGAVKLFKVLSVH